MRQSLTKPLPRQDAEKLDILIQVQTATGYISTLDELAAVFACANPDEVTEYLSNLTALDCR